MADPNLSPDEVSEADFWHGQGMPNAGVAGMLGAASQESQSSPNASNPASGASGIYQDLGSRAAGVNSYAKAHGMDPWSAEAQNDYTNDELRGKQDQGNEHAVGTSLFNATDPGQAATNMVTDFERPEHPQGESQKAALHANEVMGALNSRYGANGQPNMEAGMTQEGDQGPSPELSAALGKYKQGQQPPGTAGKWDNQKIPAGNGAPSPNPLADSLALYQQHQAAQAHTDAKAQGQVGDGQDWGSWGHALMVDVPNELARGSTMALGLPADALNAASNYFATHPHDAAVAGMGDGAMGAMSDLDSLPAYDPNSKGIHIPAGTSDIQQLIKTVTGAVAGPSGSVDLAKPSQYPNLGAEMLGHGLQFVGAGLSPGGIASDVGKAAEAASTAASPLRSVTGSVLGGLYHHVFAPISASGGMDIGNWAMPGPAGQVLGLAGRGALIKGIEKGVEGINAARNSVATATTSAGNQVRGAIAAGTGEAGAPAAQSQALSNLENYQEPIPGYTTPAMLRTGDTALQEFSNQVLKNDQRYHNDFVKEGGLGDTNVNALEAQRPSGNATDAISAIQNAQARRQSMIDTALNTARQSAQDTEDRVTNLTIGGQLPQAAGERQLGGYQKGQAFIGALQGLRDDVSKHVDQSWQDVRDLGFTKIQPSTDLLNGMYDKLEGVMGEALRTGQGDNLPWKQLNSLYKGGNPRSMFDQQGNRIPETIWSGPTLSSDRLYGEGTTLDQLKGIDSNVSNAMRMEQNKISGTAGEGNPSLFRNLTQVRQPIWSAIENGAKDAGGNVSYALQNAMDASKQYHTNFSHGLIGDLLSQTNSAKNAPETMRKYLGNTQNAIQGAGMFKSALEQSTGAAAARLNVARAAQNGGPELGSGASTSFLDPSLGAEGASPPTQFKNAMVDYFRQQYANTRADQGVTAASKWLTAHQGMFSSLGQAVPEMSDLNSQLQAWHNSSDVMLPKVERVAQDAKSTLNNNAAQLFLGGNGGGRLDSVLKSGNPAQAMGGMIADVKQHGTGGAYTGLQDMMFDRIFHEAQVNDPMRPGKQYYSGTAAQQFMNGQKRGYEGVPAAFGELAKDDPDWASGVQRVVDTMAMEDRARTGTGIKLPEGTGPGKGSKLTSTLLNVGGRIAGNFALSPLIPSKGGGESIQAASIASSIGSQFAQSLPGTIQGAVNKVDPVLALHAATRAAVHDPDTLRGMLAPVAGPSGSKWAAHIEPWLKSLGVMMPQGLLNPGLSGQGTENIGDGSQ